MELIMIRICKGPYLENKIFSKILKTTSYYTSFESLFQFDSISLLNFKNDAILKIISKFGRIYRIHLK